MTTDCSPNSDANSVSRTCKTCGWWYKNPTDPDKFFGICTSDTHGVVDIDYRVTARSKTCKKWVSMDDVQFEFDDVMVHNQFPHGCATCEFGVVTKKLHVCTAPAIASRQTDVQPVVARRMGSMTHAMCRHSRWSVAMHQFRGR